jgi:hypothetical protein
MSSNFACSWQDLGDSVWAVLSAAAPNASSIAVYSGVIEASSCLDPKGLIRLELGGKRALGPAGAQRLGQVLADSATPSLLTRLEIRSVAVNVHYQSPAGTAAVLSFPSRISSGSMSGDA